MARSREFRRERSGPKSYLPKRRRGTPSGMAIHALILAGGAGTRFWPASRASHPKQLLPLTSDRPLLSETIGRIRGLVGENLLVASGATIADATIAAIPELRRDQMLVEPVARNTAPCIGWGAATIARRDPEGVVLVLPSDHHIADRPAFLAALELAIASAREGRITTLGIQPTRAETGYGYIEVASPEGAVRDVVRFVEKPSREIAEAYVASGKHLWNGGMFVFRAKDMLAAIRAHRPALADGLDAIDRAAAEGREAEAVREIFGTLPAVSIDVGVMEKVSGLRVVPADIGWSDVGSWEAAWELATRDERGNAAKADALFVDACGNLVVDLRTAAPKPRVIALVGIDDLVVVETDDALLVVSRERSQDVKKVVDELRTKKRTGHV
jgi:mannose-1-phosphate guanylyltransferase